MLTDSYTGEVTARKIEDFEVMLASGAHLKFETVYRYEDRQDGTLRYPELIARHTRDILVRDLGDADDRLLDEIDDFLALVSFAARYRSACLGYDASTQNLESRVRSYRGNVTVPRPSEWDRDEAVIDLSDFKEFIRTTYAKFIATGPHPFIRHALHLAVPRVERTMESSFTALYAALETITLWYRQENRLEYIVEGDAEWKNLRDDIREYIRNHPVLKGDDPSQKAKRAMIGAKLDELRRVPFRMVFQRFCEDFSVTLDDLWPMFDRLPEVSLTEIRNRIVHGATFESSRNTALIGAGHHLRWTVDRMLLGLFGWPVERSKVNHDFLRNFTAMVELNDDREAIR